jgi:hypothetical protein
MGQCPYLSEEKAGLASWGTVPITQECLPHEYTTSTVLDLGVFKMS